MEYLAVSFYIILFIWVISQMRFFRLEKLPNWVVYALFAVKVIGGMAYYYIHNEIYPIDQNSFFLAGEVIHSSLSESLWYYLRLVFGPNGTYLDLPIFKYAYYCNYWTSSGSYTIVRFHAFCHLFSMGYFTVHVIFMAFLMLIASLLFYKVLIKLSLYHPYLLLAILFGIPSLIFWTTGIHKDGFIYVGLGICLYNLYEFVEERAKWYNLFGLFLGIFLISAVRLYLNVLLFPALAMLFYTLLRPENALWKFTFVYIVGAVAMILLNALIPSMNIYEILANRQVEFMSELSGSNFEVRPLEPNLLSIVAFTPIALFNAIFRPLPWEISSLVQMVSGVEIALLSLIFILGFVYRKPTIKWHPVIVFILFYALSNLLLIGMLVSNSGTLVRYRAIALSFLVLVVFQMIDFRRWKRLSFLAVD